MANNDFLENVKKTQDDLKNILLDTPLSIAPALSKLSNANIYLKKENLQKTGSFKLRGAFSKINSLTKEEKQRGIIASSAGNHAQGVAFSAMYFNIKAVIVMPENTPLTKINGVKSYGADIVLYGDNYDEAYSKAKELEKKHNYTFIHPYAQEEVIIGQGTIALEILDAFRNIGKIDKIIIPIGGGGLISGMAKTIKTLSPTTKVIGVNASGANAMKLSFDTKTIQDTKKVKTIADGIAVKSTNKYIFNKYITKYVDEIVQVDDDEIAYAVLFLLENQKVLTEGAGSVSVASVLRNKIQIKKDENIVCLLSGGNIDVTMLSIIIQKGIALSKRSMDLEVTLVDKPGSLNKLTQILQENNANIIHIQFDRTSTLLDYGDANVRISLETKGKEHQQQIIDSLNKFGYLAVKLDQ